MKYVNKQYLLLWNMTPSTHICPLTEELSQSLIDLPGCCYPRFEQVASSFWIRIAECIGVCGPGDGLHGECRALGVYMSLILPPISLYLFSICPLSIHFPLHLLYPNRCLVKQRESHATSAYSLFASCSSYYTILITAHEQGKHKSAGQTAPSSV